MLTFLAASAPFFALAGVLLGYSLARPGGDCTMGPQVLDTAPPTLAELTSSST